MEYDELTNELGKVKKELSLYKSLFETKQKFIDRTLFASACICEFDTLLNVTYMNDAAEKMFKIEFSGDKQIPALRFIHESDQERLKRDTFNLLDGDYGHPKEYLAVQSDGTAIRIMVSSAPLLKDESVVGIRSHILDITDVAYYFKERNHPSWIDLSVAQKKLGVLEQKIFATNCNSQLITKDSRMLEIYKYIEIVSTVPTTVLITGETGTGKEVVASKIHKTSPAEDRPFIAINCGALPEGLLESELFGHKAGSFTDAKKDKKGKFEEAHGGTLFLDEIGDMPLAMQVKLLRVLQEKKITPIGGQEKEIDVRVICATHKDLREEVREKRFREDLFYRINVLHINLPPLRERKADIPLLCKHFINKFNFTFGKHVDVISHRALQILLQHNFSGNIRELINIIEHAVVFCSGNAIEPEHLPPYLTCVTEKRDNSNHCKTERELIIDVLRKSENKIDAAKTLGMHKATLYRKIAKYSILNIEY